MSNRIKVTIGAVLALVVFLGIIFFSRNNEPALLLHRDFEGIKKSGRLRVITEKSSVGFQLTSEKVSGFQFDLIKAFADSMNLELEIILENDFDSCINGLLSNKCDVLAMNVPNTQEMKAQLALSIPILNSRQMLIQRNRDSDSSKVVREHFDLKKDTIFITENSPFKMRLEHLSDEIADTVYVQEVDGKSTEDLVQMVSEGKIKFTICDELQAKRLKKRFPDIDISLPLGFNQHYSWAVNPKSKELLLKMDDFLHYFLFSTDYWEIYRKYY